MGLFCHVQAQRNGTDRITCLLLDRRRPHGYFWADQVLTTMRYLALLIALLAVQSVVLAQPSVEETKIRILLANQVTQWNRGNIDGYMVGYWEHDSLVFIGKNGPTYGYQATLDRYKKAYPDLARMGTLTSTVINLRLLSPEWAYVTGQWQLKRTVGDAGGYYTLLLRKINGEWVIVEDHTS